MAPLGSVGELSGACSLASQLRLPPRFPKSQPPELPSPAQLMLPAAASHADSSPPPPLPTFVLRRCGAEIGGQPELRPRHIHRRELVLVKRPPPPDSRDRDPACLCTPLIYYASWVWWFDTLDVFPIYLPHSSGRSHPIRRVKAGRWSVRLDCRPPTSTGSVCRA